MRQYSILFLCTGNSARSIMAEGLVNLRGQGRFVAWSAGSKPVGKVNPWAIEMLHFAGYDARGARSKSWDEFAHADPLKSDCPPMDFIITVCSNAASEACPVWPGHPAVAHWGFDDPAAVEGSEAEIRAAFTRVFAQIDWRVKKFLALPVEQLDRMAVLQHLREIGENLPDLEDEA